MSRVTKQRHPKQEVDVLDVESIRLFRTREANQLTGRIREDNALVVITKNRDGEEEAWSLMNSDGLPMSLVPVSKEYYERFQKKEES